MNDKTKNRLPAKVADAIREQLPEEVSVMLRNRLEQADDAIAKTGLLEEEISDLRVRVATNTKLKKLEKDLGLIDAELVERRRALDDQERDLKVKETELELAAEKRISGVLKDALLGLVRNTTYRETVVGTVPDINPNSFGATVSVSESRTKDAE